MKAAVLLLLLMEGLVINAQSTSSTSAPFSKKSECGQSRGCFSDCDASGCSYLVSWVNNDSYVTFTIEANFPSTNGEGYMALGLSDDQRMGDDGVTECVFQNTMSIFNSKNTGRSNRRYDRTAASLVKGRFADGVFFCEFKLPKSGTPDDAIFNTGRERYLLLARGTSFTDSNLAQHQDLPVRSGGLIKFISTANVEGSTVSLTFIKVHGSLMIIAWIFGASIGVLVARHFKNQWQGQTCGGEKVWFQLHRGFMILVFVAAVLGFIIIFVHVRGWSDLGKQVSKKAHPVLGVIVTALCVLNPIMAIFRPHPNEPNRPIFNWAHFAVGSLAHVLGVITVFLGVNLGQLNIPEYVTWILVGYVCWQLIIELLLTCFRCFQSQGKSRKGHLYGYEMRQHGHPVEFQPSETSERNSPASQGLLLTHIIVITGITVAIMYPLAMAN